MKTNYRGFVLDSTEHGVDIFRDGGWVQTLQSDDGAQPEANWISRGEQWVDELLDAPTDELPGNEPENHRRAARAAAALASYLAFESEEEDEDSLTDLLSDLHHLLHLRGLEAGKEMEQRLDDAYDHFMAEISGDDE